MIVKKTAVYLAILALLVCSCRDSRASAILTHYSDDLQFSFSDEVYFIARPVYTDYLGILRRFNLNTEYDRDILPFLSADYIRSHIMEIRYMQFISDNMTILVQFPNEEIFHRYLEQFTTDPFVSRDELAQFLRYEYTALAYEDETAWYSDNYFRLLVEESDHQGVSYMPIDRGEWAYFISDEFEADMAAFSTWVIEKKWEDRNSLIILGDDNIYQIYTFDSSNDLPVINDIAKVSAFDQHTLITQTGFFNFEQPHDATEVDTAENPDGSMDILFLDDSGIMRGIRVFVSGAFVEIDQFRRIIHPG